jgi:glycosyltransferase involved in cell wall biosynthesis
MSSFVSIGIPCFNAERWISGAIESALGQTWTDKEVIVVDDGSTDGSLDRVRGFADRVRLIRCEHRGGNHARNEILRNARGEWVQFLDADDYLEPEKISRQFAEGSMGETADVLYSPYWFERVGDAAERWQSELHSENDLFTQWIAWELPQTGAALWRKRALAELGGWKEDQPCCQEHELYLRALKAGLRFVFTPTTHAVYRLWSEDTVCRKDPSRTIRVRTQLIDDARAWLTERHRWSALHQRTAARACFEMARTLARNDVDQASAYFSERRTAGLIQPGGPAAPLAYRLAYHVLGFEKAERLAARRRE